MEFHGFERDTSAGKVTGFWRRIPKAAGAGGEEPSFDDMIYYAEPWYIACNLAEQELPLAQYRLAYETLLHRNDLA